MDFKTLNDIDVHGKTVLLRADLNVPVHKGKVTDTSRIDRLKPTIDFLQAHNARILILSHFGRPQGKPQDEFSLSFLPPVLSRQWGYPVAFAEDCIGPKAAAAGTGITLLENTRFHDGEERNDPAFIKDLATLGDIFVHDAFSAAHRAHASTEGLAHHLPTVAGFLMAEELNALSIALETPERPLATIVGGAKISTKLELLGNLIKKTDILIIGGAMANTFLAAQDIDVKNSLYEKDMLAQAAAIMEKAADENCEIILPLDAIAAQEFAAHAPHSICDTLNVPEGHMILDIGPQSVELIKAKLQSCATLVWNGPVGAFELEPFNNGTNALACFAAELTQSHALKSIAGGGDTVAALEHAGVKNKMSYVSTAGGAFLEWLEGKTLPGVAALSAYQNAA